MIGRLKFAIVFAILLLAATIVVVGLKMVREREVVFEPEEVELEELAVEPGRRPPRIEEIELEEMEPEEGVVELSREVGLGELPSDEMVLPPEPEEAEVIPLAPKAPVKRGHDVKPGPEDLGRLRESGAIIY